MSQRGSIIVVLLPFTLLLFSITLFMVDLGRGFFWGLRAQVLADATVLSSLRIRAEGLERLAERWSSWGSLFERGDARGAYLLSSSWDDVHREAQELDRAIPGYRGRIGSVVTVVAEANGTERDRIQITEREASDLGVLSQPQWIEDERGRRKLLEGAWYKRTWAPQERLADPPEVSEHQAQVFVSLLGAKFVTGEPMVWALTRKGSAHLLWDVSRDDALIQERGNSGYPRSWEEALEDAALNPYRFPVFRAALINE